MLISKKKSGIYFHLHRHGTSAPLPTATSFVRRRCISCASSAPASGEVATRGRRSLCSAADATTSPRDVTVDGGYASIIRPSLLRRGEEHNRIPSSQPIFSKSATKRAHDVGIRPMQPWLLRWILVPSSLHYACPQEDTAELCGADIRATACSFQQGIRMCFADPTTDCRSSFSVAPVKHIRPSSS
jgi:hypothetical protein